jgi:hypothetical protein
MMQDCEFCKCEYPPLKLFYYDAEFNKKNDIFNHLRVCNGCLDKLSKNKYKKTNLGEIDIDNRY